jgi:hypothetical protein
MSTVKILRSTTPGAVPTTLLSGQIAINEHDGIIFWLDATSGSVAFYNFTSPIAPTQVSTDSSTRVATTAFVQSLLTALLNGAPAGLSTLKELADAINDDTNFAGTLTAALGNRLRFDAAQALTPAQQSQAVSNLGLPGLGTVSAENIATVAQIRALTAGVAIDTGGLSSALAPVAGGNVSGNFTPDFTQFVHIAYTLTANSTLKFPTVSLTPVVGRSGTIKISENATGAFTLGFDVPGTSGYIFDSGATASIDSAASRDNLFGYTILSTTRIFLSLVGKGAR